MPMIDVIVNEPLDEKFPSYVNMVSYADVIFNVVSVYVPRTENNRYPLLAFESNPYAWNDSANLHPINATGYDAFPIRKSEKSLNLLIVIVWPVVADPLLLIKYMNILNLTLHRCLFLYV